MVTQLNSFTGEVTRVAREVTEGKLGEQALELLVFGRISHTIKRNY